jgi:hypothetical protein
VRSLAPEYLELTEADHGKLFNVRVLNTGEERVARYHRHMIGGTPHRLASSFWGSLAGKVRIEDGLGLEHAVGAQGSNAQALCRIRAEERRREMGR